MSGGTGFILDLYWLYDKEKSAGNTDTKGLKYNIHPFFNRHKSMSEKTVMIIDDSKYIIGLLERFFVDKLHFIVVATALDGTNVLELYRQYRPNLLTLDLSMPDKKGVDVLKDVLEADPGANVLIISAVRSDAMLKCMTMGAKGYVEKPLRFSDLDFVSDFIETVKEVCGMGKEEQV